MLFRSEIRGAAGKGAGRGNVHEPRFFPFVFALGRAAAGRAFKRGRTYGVRAVLAAGAFGRNVCGARNAVSVAGRSVRASGRGALRKDGATAARAFERPPDCVFYLPSFAIGAAVSDCRGEVATKQFFLFVVHAAKRFFFRSVHMRLYADNII